MSPTINNDANHRYSYEAGVGDHLDECNNFGKKVFVQTIHSLKWSTPGEW